MQLATLDLIKRRASLLAERHQAETTNNIDLAIEIGWQAIAISEQIIAAQQAGERIDISLLDWRIWQQAVN